MNNIMRIAFVAVLAATVTAVIVAKRSRSRPAQNPAAPVAGPLTQPATAGPAVTVRKPLPKLVDVSSDICIPCKKMVPILEALRTELDGQIDVDFVNIRINPNATQQYGIRLIPTQIFYDASGKELSRHEGFLSREDILASFKKHGITVSARGQ